MTFASDQKSNSQHLSATSQRMLELREAVFAEWEKRIRSSLKLAEALRHPVLINTLPGFYDNIAEALTSDYPRASGSYGSSLAGEHGGERARLTAYDYQTLISEYRIFRWTVFDVFQEHGLELSDREAAVLNMSIDEGIKEAVIAFGLVHSALHERFIAALTHDLRSPLGAASLSAEVILRSDDPAEMKQFAVKILDNIGRVDAMIKELLDSMACQSGQQLPLDITYFDMLELVEEIRAQAASERSRINISGKSVNGWWSRDAMKRAVENVINNAVKYGTADTPIHIKVDRAYERIMISVHNEGTPIPLEEQETIFHMYVRAQSAKTGNKTGWGVGLPFVRGVTERHGGSVTVDSTLERGTTFVMDVPIDARPYTEAPSLAS